MTKREKKLENLLKAAIPAMTHAYKQGIYLKDWYGNIDDRYKWLDSPVHEVGELKHYQILSDVKEELGIE